MSWERSKGVATAGVALAVLTLAVTCGPSGDKASDSILETTRTDGGDARPDPGSPDGGRPDGGTHDGGAPDGGHPDGGHSDGGIIQPDLSGWTFYGIANGGPQTVLGVTADQGGNIWVAGGEEGLFLLRPQSTRFRRFTMDDGLRPYGYLPDGGDPIGEKYLNVLSVAGGAPGVVFVGYDGKPPPPDQLPCEQNWDDPDESRQDPNIYKSGDADRLTLSGDRISVVHYDIFSGPNQVPAEPRGRERLCSIYRIIYDPTTHSVWFGGNHGFAWGDPTHPEDRTCNGDPRCSGVLEHSHPAFNCWSDETRTHVWFCTDAYLGMGVNSFGDLWAAGRERTTKFRYATYGNNFWRAQAETEDSHNWSDRFDIWPDLVTEPDIPTPSERVDDYVSDIAVMPDDSVWIGSSRHGMAHFRIGGPTQYRLDTVIDSQGRVTGLERDSRDGSLWIGYASGGFARLMPNGDYLPYDARLLGPEIVRGSIPDIQSDYFNGHRRILVAFKRTGAIGIFTGD